MLHGAMVPTKHPRAVVLKIRTDAAAAMPGVVRIFTAADVPGPRGVGLTIPDMPVFVAEGETTCCVSDFLAMVVADTQFHARQAAAKVEVEYEVLEPITDPLEALKPGAPQVHSTETLYPAPNLLQPITAFARGDVDAALKDAAHVIEADVRDAGRGPRVSRARGLSGDSRRARVSRSTPTARDRSTTSSRSPAC